MKWWPGRWFPLGDSETAKRTLEMIGKLSNLSSLGEGEQQQVLTELASSLGSLLEKVELQDGASKKPGEALPLAANTSASSEPAGIADATVTDPADSRTVPGADIKVESDSGNNGSTVKSDAATDNTNKSNPAATQNADSAQNVLATLETVAAAAGELAETKPAGIQVVDRQADIRQPEVSHSDKLADRIAGVLRETASAPQMKNTTRESAAAAGKPAEPQATNPAANAETKPATAESNVMDKPTERAAAQAKNNNATTAAASVDNQTSETRAVKTDSLATALAADSESQKVTVPVSLSSLNKSRKEQSRTLKAEAVSAFSSNSKSTSRAQGEGNDFMKAMRAAAGEKGMSDLVEATVVQKKAEVVEALGRVEGADADQKPGGVQVQGGIRTEQTAGRIQQFRGELAQQARTVETANQSEAFEKIINSARLTKAGATTELTMKLEPDHLGMMRVRMSVDDQKVMHASIQVESHEARSMIEGNLHRLRESLAEQGIKVEKFSVDVRQDQQQQSQHQSAGADREGYWQQSGHGTSRGSAGSSGTTGSGSEDTEALSDRSNTKAKKYDYSTLEWVA